MLAYPIETAAPLQHAAVLELATAEDLATGLAAVAELVRRACGAARVEWWTAGEQVAGAGEGYGCRTTVSLDALGEIVVFGGSVLPALADALRPLEPIVRRRRADERIEQLAMELARRNAALEDYASLVAHELKNPLQAALAAPGDRHSLEDALDLVEALLETARRGTDETAPAADVLARAAAELSADDVEIASDLPAELSLPATTVRVILRNLLANAVAAGARHVHVTAAHTADSWQVHVDDDGIGLTGAGAYRSGSGVGLSLNRRAAARLGGGLELTPRAHGGTRATLTLQEAPQ